MTIAFSTSISVFKVECGSVFKVECQSLRWNVGMRIVSKGQRAEDKVGRNMERRRPLLTGKFYLDCISAPFLELGSLTCMVLACRINVKLPVPLHYFSQGN